MRIMYVATASASVHICSAPSAPTLARQFPNPMFGCSSERNAPVHKTATSEKPRPTQDDDISDKSPPFRVMDVPTVPTMLLVSLDSVRCSLPLGYLHLKKAG